MAEQEAVQREVEKLREFATDLLIFAQWLTDNGEKLDKLPWVHTAATFSIFCNEHDDEGELDIPASQRAISKVAKIFGSATKDFSSDDLIIAKKFGKTVTLRAAVDRETVCTKKVIKKEYVKYSSDGYWKEDVEWDCHTPSILALSEDS